MSCSGPDHFEGAFAGVELKSEVDRPGKLEEGTSQRVELRPVKLISKVIETVKRVLGLGTITVTVHGSDGVR